jgi:hypothetical protein
MCCFVPYTFLVRRLLVKTAWPPRAAAPPLTAGLLRLAWQTAAHQDTYDGSQTPPVERRGRSLVTCCLALARPVNALWHDGLEEPRAGFARTADRLLPLASDVVGACRRLHLCARCVCSVCRSLYLSLVYSGRARCASWELRITLRIWPRQLAGKAVPERNTPGESEGTATRLRPSHNPERVEGANALNGTQRR